MRNTLYAIALFLIIAWAVGFFFLDAGSVAHALLIVAAIVIILGAIKRKRIL